MENRVSNLETKVATVEAVVGNVLTSLDNVAVAMKENTKALQSNEASINVFIAKHEDLSKLVDKCEEMRKEDNREIKAFMQSAIDELKRENVKIRDRIGSNEKAIASHNPVVESFKKLNNMVIVSLLAFVGTLATIVGIFITSGVQT